MERIREPRARLVQHGDPLSVDAFAIRTRPRRHVRHHERARAFHFASLTMLLIRGTKESAFVNGLIVILKVSIVLLFIGIGWQFINPAHHTPFIPSATTHVTAQGITHHYGGILGILGAAGVVFFAYIGFDAVSTAAQESRT